MARRKQPHPVRLGSTRTLELLERSLARASAAAGAIRERATPQRSPATPACVEGPTPRAPAKRQRAAGAALKEARVDRYFVTGAGRRLRSLAELWRKATPPPAQPLPRRLPGALREAAALQAWLRQVLGDAGLVVTEVTRRR